MSGITPLLQILEELEQKNIPGRILTTDYLNFSEPRALEKLAGLKNIELRMYSANASDVGFHTKGYIFKEQEIYRIIVGSSNMTLSALTTNKEWNTRLVSTEQGEYAQQVLDEFGELWNSQYTSAYEEFIEQYRLHYEVVKKQKRIVKQAEIPSIDQYRLQQALEENLLCPFHYFGITDLEINGQVFDDNTGVRNFAYLVCDARVDYVIEKANYYGYSGERVKGLIFCSRKEEGIELSKKFNSRGYHTEFLCGDDSQNKREDCIERLTNDDRDDRLDYIFTIDIFNEGVDIPEINQVIMLRPTESPIVFIQQLGRGLRKAEDKEYVVILDFIGNYMNNFMIPIALSGDRSYNKDTIRRYVREGSKVIPGSSTIHFDEISKKRIYASIDNAKTNDLKLLRESYQNLKYKLGRIPSIQDFDEYGAVDITKIFEKMGSYYAFLVKYEKEYAVRLTEEEAQIIEYLSRKVAKGKRVHELEMLKDLQNQPAHILHFFKTMLQQKYDITLLEEVQDSVIRNLTNEFLKEEEKKKFNGCVFLELNDNEEYQIAPHFKQMLKNKIFSDMVYELVDFGIKRYQKNYANRYKDTNFQLYQKYTYEDVCRLLNWKRNLNAQNIGGYFYDSETKTMPVFINYDKAEDAIAYEDRFISNQELIALSKHPRKITSSDVAHIYKGTPEDADNRIFLFVRKNKDDKEAKEFYFLGEIYAVGEPKPIYMESTKDDAFEITYRLDVPVRDDIYDYITGE